MFSPIASRQRFAKRKSPKRGNRTPPLRHHTRLRIEQLEPRVLLSGSGSLRGTVFDDLDGDGVFDRGEPGLPGVEVELQRVGDVARTFNTSGPEGQSLAICGDRYLIGEPGRKVVRLFDLATGDILHTFSDPNPEIHGYFGQAVAFVGENVLIGSPFGAPPSVEVVENQPFAYLFDGGTGELLQSFHDPWGVDQDHSLSVAGHEDRILIGDSMDDAGYLFDATSGELLRRFSVSWSSSPDFGKSVAFVGDNVLIGGSNAFYLFDGGTGEQLRSIATPDPENRFGHRLDVSGTKILARTQTPGSFTGTVYLFETETGALLQTFEDPDPGENTSFGCSLAFFGDNVLIGADGKETPGSVFLFDAATAELLETFHGPSLSRYDGFGSSIAADGEFFLVGAIGRGTYHVHLFNTTGSTRIDNSVSVTTNAQGGYCFNAVHPDNYVVSVVVPEGYAQSFPNGDGAHLTIRNLNPDSPGNGTRTVATDDGAYAISVQKDDVLFGLDLGAVNDVQLPVPDPVPPPEDGTASGTVFDDLDGNGVFDPGERGLPGLEVRLERLDGHLRTFESRAMDGNSVAIRGNRYLIGVPGNGGPGGQVVYLFDLATGDVLHTFSNPNPEVRGNFGQAVAFVGNDVLVAAPYDPWLDGGQTQILEDQPFAYLFDGATGSLLQSFRDPFGGDNGHRLSLILDDSRVLIGDSRDGAAYLFDPTNGDLLQRFSVPHAAGRHFGASVAFVGNNVLVNAGNALYLFDGATGKALRSFSVPDPAKYFASPQAVSGTKILACARGSGGAESTVYLFEAITGRLLQTFTSPNTVSEDRFGESVAFLGDQVLIGASGRSEPGTVYLFDISTGELLETYESPSSRPSEQRGFGRCTATDGSHFLVGAGGYGSDLVHLFSSAASTVADTITATSDAEGRYRFEDVEPGIYVVSAILPEGCSQTLPNNQGTYVISIADGEQPANLDFGAVDNAPPPTPEPPPALKLPVEPDPVPMPDPPPVPDPPPIPDPLLVPDPVPVIGPNPVPDRPPVIALPLPPDVSATFEFTGTVVYANLEGGFYGILADDGGFYDPLNLPDEFAQQDARVRVVARARYGVPSFHMCGTILEIIDIQPGESEAAGDIREIVAPADPLPEPDPSLVHFYFAGLRLADPFPPAPVVDPYVLETALCHAEQGSAGRPVELLSPSNAPIDAVSTDDLSPESESRRALRFDAALDDWELETSLPLEVELDRALSDLLFEMEPGELAFGLL